MDIETEFKLFLEQKGNQLEQTNKKLEEENKILQERLSHLEQSNYAYSVIVREEKLKGLLPDYEARVRQKEEEVKTIRLQNNNLIKLLTDLKKTRTTLLLEKSKYDLNEEIKFLKEEVNRFKMKYKYKLVKTKSAFGYKYVQTKTLDTLHRMLNEIKSGQRKWNSKNKCWEVINGEQWRSEKLSELKEAELLD